MLTKAQAIKQASNWVGKYYKQGEKEQCANFIRSILTWLPSSKRPWDYDLLPENDRTLGPGYANSLFGDDVGKKLSKPEAGALVGVPNTYGEYKDGVITHVGLAVSEHQYVHRPTFIDPVKISDIPDNAVFCLPVYASEPKQEDKKIKLYYNNGKCSLIVFGKRYVLEEGTEPVMVIGL